MTDEVKRKLGIAAAAVVILIFCYSLWAYVIHTNPNSPDVPNGTFWICKTGGHHFHMTLKEYSNYTKDHYGEPVACPTCGSKETIRAYRCDKCGEYYPTVRGEQPPCPKCGYKPPADKPT